MVSLTYNCKFWNRLARGSNHRPWHRDAWALPLLRMSSIQSELWYAPYTNLKSNGVIRGGGGGGGGGGCLARFSNMFENVQNPPVPFRTPPSAIHHTHNTNQIHRIFPNWFGKAIRRGSSPASRALSQESTRWPV